MIAKLRKRICAFLRIAPEQYVERKRYYLHMWDAADRCIWCRGDKLQYSDCRPCPGPEVRA